MEFMDAGTGSTNYAVEFSPILGPSAVWTNLAGAVLSDLGGGRYKIGVPDTQSGMGFFRVRGLGGTISLVTASFASAYLETSEGGTANPTITFNGPFYGVVRYSISGTATSGDYVNLSGEVFVNGGTTATIPMTLTDNGQIGQLKYLTLRLEAGTGYNVARGGVETTITIDENDALWQGKFTADNATLGFTLAISQVGNLHQASFKGAGTGFFPTNEMPAGIAIGTDSFAANVAGIPVSAGETLLNMPANLTLLLSAMNGLTNQSVSATEISGVGTLISQYAGQPQLNTTNAGTFILFKPPVTPATNEVQLVNIP